MLGKIIIIIIIYNFLSRVAHNKPVSQACAVTKSNKFWRATGGQSNLSDRMEDCSIIWQKCSCVSIGSFVVVSRLYAKFDCPVSRQNFSLLFAAHDCETDLTKANKHVSEYNGLI